MMIKESAVISIFDRHRQAEAAIKALQKSGFDMRKLSIVGKGYRTEEHPLGFYTTADRVKYWGSSGALWGTLCGMLFGATFFWMPGAGPLALGGPLLPILFGAFEGAFVVGVLAALAALIYSLGVPSDSIVRYETAIKADKYLVVVHGDAGEIETARKLFTEAEPPQPVQALDAA